MLLGKHTLMNTPLHAWAFKSICSLLEICVIYLLSNLRILLILFGHNVYATVSMRNTVTVLVSTMMINTHAWVKFQRLSNYVSGSIQMYAIYICQPGKQPSWQVMFKHPWILIWETAHNHVNLKPHYIEMNVAVSLTQWFLWLNYLDHKQ